MRRILVFCSMILLLSGVFAVFPGESVHVMDFVDCEYLNVVADENCFVFDGCNRTDSFGFEWRCQCVNDGFSLNATVRADASVGSFSVSGSKFEVEVVSIGWFEKKQTIFKELVTVFLGDSNQEVVVVDGNCGESLGCEFSEDAYLRAIEMLEWDVNRLESKNGVLMEGIVGLEELLEGNLVEVATPKTLEVGEATKIGAGIVLFIFAVFLFSVFKIHQGWKKKGVELID